MTATEIANLRMIAKDTLARATRHKRGATDPKYLLMDLDYVELQMVEALERLDRLGAH